MKFSKNTRITFLIICFIAAGFLFAFLFFTTGDKEELYENTNTENVINYEEIPEAKDEITEHYLLNLQNGTLCLYSVCGKENELIKQTELTDLSLPYEDIERLEMGIHLDSLEEGYQLMEDFTE